jgi:hypothetical protein
MIVNRSSWHCRAYLFVRLNLADRLRDGSQEIDLEASRLSYAMTIALGVPLVVLGMIPVILLSMLGVFPPLEPGEY